MSDFMGSAVAEVMVTKDSKQRLSMLRAIDELHVTAFITWLGLELGEGNLKEDVYPKEIVESFLEHFTKSITMSVQATCEANEWDYASTSDHNRKVRDEILNEIGD